MYKSKNGYIIPIQTSVSLNPNDSTVYYIGCRPGIATVEGYAKVYCLRAGTITAGYVNLLSSSADGTAEDQILQIKKNGTTLYTFATVSTSATMRLFANYDLTIPVAQGDYIELVWTTPAWVTNPQGVYAWGYLLINT